MRGKRQREARHLVLVLGDQLNQSSAAFDGFDPSSDVVWMAEVAEEARHVWSHKARITIFLTAMRHFRNALFKRGITVHYHPLNDPQSSGSFSTELRRAVRQLKPRKLIVVEPGEWRVKQILLQTARDLEVQLEIRADRHFICSADEFSEHAASRRRLIMEFFYRQMRRKAGVLMDGDQPLGGKWNYDAENRRPFPKAGPAAVPEPVCFAPDDITRDVIALVKKRFPDHPGSLDRFDWAVTADQAKKALENFIEGRLSLFGPYQDAMWHGHPFLYHSRLSSALNLKLLHPREVIKAAEDALQEGRATINSVEGFVRQILGWREYVRGIYWLHMPAYADHNRLNALLPLPRFYWTAETDMSCIQQCIRQTLDYGFAHHIQRLMVTGLFALLLGVNPKEVHKWYLAIYVDAIEWAELPNTLGMSQYADGGMMASKPYVATGKYMKRMSNYCEVCRYDSSKEVGKDACPFTTLYWDFLLRHEKTLSANPRIQLQLRNARRFEQQRAKRIRKQAEQVRAKCVN